MPKNIIIIGAGGHGKVIADIIDKAGDNIVGFIDANEKTPAQLMGFAYLGDFSCIKTLREHYFVIAIGANNIRKKIDMEYEGLKWYTAIHPSAQISMDVTIGKGTVVMANAAINASARIGKHCIINTGAVVEHDDIISDYVHISPNAALGGTVKVGELSHIGIGACVKHSLSITGNCIIGAGAVVVKDIDTEGTYVGVPAKKV